MDFHSTLGHPRRDPSVLRGDYISNDEDVSTSFIYPHLQVSDVFLYKAKLHVCIACS